METFLDSVIKAKIKNKITNTPLIIVSMFERGTVKYFLIKKPSRKNIIESIKKIFFNIPLKVIVASGIFHILAKNLINLSVFHKK